MIKRRRAAALAASIVLAASFAGCASGADEGDGRAELKMLVNLTPNLTEEWWKDLVAPFEEKNPDIKVVILNPGQEGTSALPRLLASGDAPDVIQSVTPTPELAPELVDLSGYEWASSGPLADQYTIDGKNYMAGVGVQLQSLFFYNKTAFSEAGITAVPKTVEELDAAAQKLHAAGWIPFQTGGGWMSALLLQAVGLPTTVAEHPQWYKDMSDGTLTFSGTYSDAVDRYADWVAAGYIPQTDLGVQYPDAEQNFLAGKSAIYAMGSWFAAAQASSADSADIGVFPAPALKGVDNPAMGANVASPYSIMRVSDHQDAAARLVEYLTTDKTAVSAQLAIDGNFRDGYEYEMTDLSKAILSIVAATPQSDYTPPGDGFGDRQLPLGYYEELNAQTQALMGGTSAADVLSAMDAWFVSKVR